MKNKIAEILLNTQAVFLSVDKPFTWASGIQSPIYCDNRKVLAFPEERTYIKTAFLDTLAQYDFDAIMGTATAGIPMASILADALDKPLGYVRGSKKDHGRNNQIEGFQKQGARVIVIEDLISTGQSVLQAVDALRQAGMEVVAVLAIFSYNMTLAADNFKTAAVPYVTLSDFDTLITLAQARGVIQAQDSQKIKKFQQNPKDASWVEG